ncbi:MAG: pyridoxal-phosphate dependent enzyme [Planctomycetales bacterium]|nr:pyridoxal-phosphate dependent enzyme [Planctomycetales bacterium]
MNPADLCSYADVFAACRQRIAPYIHCTPVMCSRQIDELAGAMLSMKCENFQRMGAFKMRGAVNALLQLTPEQQQRGVVTHSSGNFAQALALAASSVGTRATIVMPRDAPEVKKNAVRGYGGTIVECEPIVEARQAATDRIVAETGATFIHPSDDLQVILGQGTAVAELLEQTPELDCVVTPVGGGGLVAGAAIAAALHARAMGRPCPVYGGEPANVDDAFRSLKEGSIQENPPGANTIADGLKTYLGDVNFPIIQQGVRRIITVSEDQIVSAMRQIWQFMKLVVEPSAAVALAAVFADPETFAGKRVGLVLSGGNVDLDSLPFAKR